jgi:hypothetical protein
MFPLNYLFAFQMDLVITGNEAQNQIVVGVESKDMDHHRSHREPGPNHTCNQASHVPGKNAKAVALFNGQTEKAGSL